MQYHKSRSEYPNLWLSMSLFFTVFLLGSEVVQASGINTVNTEKGQVNQLQLTEAETSSSNPTQQLNAALHEAETNSQQTLFKKPDVDEAQAFDNITKSAMPMTPEQIVRLHKMLDVTQRASVVSAALPPKPTLSTQVVNLSPGAIPPVIRLQQGFVTSVVLVDETGADWPIEAYDLGNARAFNIQWQQGSNVMMLQAISLYTYGNLAVKLKGLSTPVMLTLIPGQQVVDYRIDLRIQKQGPNAKPMLVDNTPSSPSDILLGILDGIAPPGSRILHVAGGDCMAWLFGDKMYLRTSLTVLSPSWIAVMTSPDGTNAYEMEQSSTVLISRYGKPVELKIEGL
jgi:intracellular multiplication protein IcmK